MIKISFLIIFLFAGFSGSAQFLPKVLNFLDFPYDSVYISDYGRSIIVKPITACRSFGFSRNADDLYDDFSAQAKVYAGVGGAYKNLQLQIIFPVYSVTQAGLNENARSADFNLGLKTNSLNGALSYRKFTGFLARNSRDETIVLKDSEVLRIGIKGFYSFNSSYSMNAAYKQTQEQKKSVGSFFAGIEGFYWRSESSELPQITFGPLFNVGLILGYGHNFIPAENWYISPMVFTGSGLVFPVGQKPEFSRNELSFPADWRLSAGFSNERFVAGIIMQQEIHRLPSPYDNLVTKAFYLKFNAALRFKINSNGF